MRLRNLLFLSTRRFRAHPLQELLALAGIAVGVALVFAVLVADASIAGATRGPRQALVPHDRATALFAAVSALVGVLLACSAMLLTAPERRRFLADLRLDGLGDATIVRLALLDALLLGLAASAAGLLLGELLSRSVFAAVPGDVALAAGERRIVTAEAVAFAVAGGLGATAAAGLRPLGDLASRRPLDAVPRGDQRDEHGPARAGALLAGGVAAAAATAAVVVLAPAAALAAFGLLVVAMLLTVPAVLTGLLRLLDRLARRLRSPMLLVSLGELRTTMTRSFALAATGALAVCGGVAVEGSHHDLQRGIDRDAPGTAALAGQGLERVTQIAALVLIAGALALAAALGAVAWSRRPRLAALKLTGFGDGAVWRALLLESAIVLGAGCSLGVAFGLAGQFVLTRWLRVALELPASWSAAGWLAAATFAGVTAVALVVAALPGWAAARVSPLAGAQEE